MRGKRPARTAAGESAPSLRRAGLDRIAIGGLLSGALVISGCGGASQAERDAVAAAHVRADQARIIARQAGLSPDVGDFLARAADASGQRYTVVYSSGAGQQVTVVSKPPDRQVDIQGASGADSLDRILTKGGKSYECHRGGGKWTCQEGGSAASSGAFTPNSIAQTITALTQLSGTYDFAISHRVIAGLAATCLAADRRPGQRADPSFGDHAALCIAPTGVILEVDGTGTPLRAVSYRPSVPSGAFVLPARPSPSGP
jgi:hypothetical protein